jgi:hypothetical protein
MQTTARPTRQTPKVSWLAALLLSLFLVLTVAPAAAAAGPVTASGTVVQASFQVTSSRSADGITILDYAETDLLSGAFSGTSSVTGTCVVRVSGLAECHAFETFTGAVDGVSGTMRFVDAIQLDTVSNSFSGSFASIGGGTGGLANAHAHGTFQGVNGAGTYTSDVVLAP